jgi:ribosome-binding protein aMBF1 (putative translation factor)
LAWRTPSIPNCSDSAGRRISDDAWDDWSRDEAAATVADSASERQTDPDPTRLPMPDDERRSKYEQACLAARRTVAMNVTELRVARGWSQAELARRSGVRNNEVADVEAGAGDMFIDTLSMLAGGLNVDISDLFRNRTESLH